MLIFITADEPFANRSPLNSLRNNLVREVISSACSGCLENLISRMSNENIVKALIKSH